MSLPPETTFDEVKVRIKETFSNPNVRRVEQVALKDGPQTFRVATIFEIIDPKTKEFHHYSLRIDSINKKKAGWFHKPEKSVTLDGKGGEIESLYRFLQAVTEDRLSDAKGDIHIISSEDYLKLESVLDALSKFANNDKLEVVKGILSQIEGGSSSVEEFVNVFQNSRDDVLHHIATASRVVEYKKEIEILKRLIDSEGSSESQFQQHLTSNPWMFGSEYSQVLDRRNWTRDNSLDFMLRRTVDGYLEIIEIKTPFRESLLNYDKSHSSYYASSKLSSVIGQVMTYIEDIDRNRDTIISKDHCDSLKIRSRVIIGRDGNEQHQSALRNFNSHLHRIEVITFDQLLRIAQRVVGVFDSSEGASENQEFLDDMPF